MMLSAGVAELVDALDLGSSDESCGGSSPSARTILSALPGEGPHVPAPREAFLGLTGTARPGSLVRPAAFQMVDLALPLGYHGKLRRLASVKLIGPHGPDETRLAVQQFTQRLWDLDDDTPCGLAEPPMQV